MKVLPPGFKIGHWTDRTAVTGCTVLLCPPQCVGGCDVRGGSPGSRELALLQSERSMQEVHAVVLTGGSAFGLSVADGVMKYLEEHDIGYRTPWVKVPIVPTAVIFDMNIGSQNVRPSAQAGYRACEAAGERAIEEGSVGVGTGATVGKWAGPSSRMMGGFGITCLTHGEAILAAAAVVNAVGDVLDEDGTILAGARDEQGRWFAGRERLGAFGKSKGPLATNTTLVVIMTNAKLSKVDVNRIAQRSHNGLARAIRPVHTSHDGDIVFALAAGTAEANVDLVAEMGAEAAAEAIRNGARQATSVEGVPAYRDLHADSPGAGSTR
jgi:L-aminopeptidase/D-esterase-like protein